MTEATGARCESPCSGVAGGWIGELLAWNVARQRTLRRRAGIRIVDFVSCAAPQLSEGWFWSPLRVCGTGDCGTEAPDCEDYPALHGRGCQLKICDPRWARNAVPRRVPVRQADQF